jgi:thymidylate synthase
MDWPLFFPQNLRLGNPASGLAICLLWTPQERGLAELSANDYALAGNLYSRDGVSFLVRNVLAQPTIRTILLCGKDMTGSGAALVALLAQGIDEQGRIVGEGTRLHPELPTAAIELFRRSVRLIDARDTMRPEQIAALAHQWQRPAEAFAPEPLIFPYHEPTSEALPAENSGFLVRAPTIRAAYLRLLWHVMTYGQRGTTQHSSDQRELLDVLTVVQEEPADPAQFSHADWMPFSRTSLGERLPDGSYSGYLSQFLEARPVEGVSYTYGARLRAYGGTLDQVAAMVRDLQGSPNSRRAVASLWEPASDPASANPPCLNLVQARIREGSLHLAAYVRSHDIYRAWASNAYGLRALQGLIAEQVGATAGELAIHSLSAHIYAHDWQAARDLLAHHYRVADPRLVRDGRGSFVIAIDTGEIVVRHYTPDGEHLQTFRGATSRELMPQLTPFVSEMSHGLYLGGELQKAEIALRLGKPALYRQDRELEVATSAG